MKGVRNQSSSLPDLCVEIWHEARGPPFAALFSATCAQGTVMFRWLRSLSVSNGSPCSCSTSLRILAFEREACADLLVPALNRSQILHTFYFAGWVSKYLNQAVQRNHSIILCGEPEDPATLCGSLLFNRVSVRRRFDRFGADCFASYRFCVGTGVVWCWL
jgi:hypothetical protein